MLYYVYLDEFGHIGPYLSRQDRKHKTSPVFGLGGIVLPYPAVRAFSSSFYKLKQALLQFEIARAGVHPAKWEKKGSALYTITNVTKYPNLRKATYAYLNKLRMLGGRVFYTGIEKDPPDSGHTSEALYLSVLKDAIRKLNNFCDRNGPDDQFCIVLDAVDSDTRSNNFRPKSVEEACRSMFGQDKSFRLLEPPFQVESHLYQNMQCADWVCALTGKLLTLGCSSEYPEYSVYEKYFAERLQALAVHSTLRKRRCCRLLSLPL